jgi:hypothetical protein
MVFAALSITIILEASLGLAGYEAIKSCGISKSNSDNFISEREKNKVQKYAHPLRNARYII